jgi:predicted HTH domain antitoxin
MKKWRLPTGKASAERKRVAAPVNDDAGREALHALAHIGDNRSIAPLLDAFEEGYKPTLVADALHAFGPAIVPPLLDRLEARPELVDRKVTVDVCAGMELSVVNELLDERLADASPQSLAARALLYLKVFGKNPALRKAVATLIQARIGSAGSDAVPGDLTRRTPAPFQGQVSCKITRSQTISGFPNLGLWATFILKMTVTIPSERLGNIALNERDALVDIAIGLYKREQVSLGRAAEISGLSSPEFLNELGRRRIPINYEADDLRLDLDTLKGLS